MTDKLLPFLEDMLSMSTGTDGRTMQIHFCRPVTAADRQAIADAHNAIVRGELTATPEPISVGDGPFHVSRSSNGKSEWFSARDAASGVSIPGKSKDDAAAMVSALNRAFAHHHRAALSRPSQVKPDWRDPFCKRRDDGGMNNIRDAYFYGFEDALTAAEGSTE